MNLELKCGKFKNDLLSKGQKFNGIYYIFRFLNGYGASIIKHETSYGSQNDLWELAVIRFNHEASNEWDIDYDTPITNDVLGYLDDEEVLEILEQIYELDSIYDMI